MPWSICFYTNQVVSYYLLQQVLFVMFKFFANICQYMWTRNKKICLISDTFLTRSTIMCKTPSCKIHILINLSKWSSFAKIYWRNKVQIYSKHKCVSRVFISQAFKSYQVPCFTMHYYLFFHFLSLLLWSMSQWRDKIWMTLYKYTINIQTQCFVVGQMTFQILRLYFFL